MFSRNCDPCVLNGCGGVLLAVLSATVRCEAVEAPPAQHNGDVHLTLSDIGARRIS